ncbi:MAG: monovalent cation/H+ antiporter complex subunit F [Vicinamibacterales bacterium]
MIVALSTAAAIALAAAIGRLVAGPRDADRVVALDLVVSASLAVVAAAALAAADPRLLDVGIGLAAVGFVGTLAWARFLDQAGGSDR